MVTLSLHQNWGFSFQDHRSISRFIAYALCSADEALKDANWWPDEAQKERTVITFATLFQSFGTAAFISNF